MYSRGDSSQIAALTIVVARFLRVSPRTVIEQVNAVLPAVREQRGR